MDQDSAICVEGVGKAYRMWETPSARITAPLLERIASVLPNDSRLSRGFLRRATSRYRDFWALKEISFSIRKGEAVGIIGLNGSGKSTLLQVIAGTLQPTTGRVHAKGRVAALLELGSGFNPDFTGRENVYLNGSVLGLSRTEIDERFNEIAAFADIGDFLEQPVKTYSSGMLMRLAFSVQTAVDPEILIVDEALSVGDAQFVAKCIKRVSDFIRNGGTLLFVSHDIGLVKQLTSRALYLDKGRQVAFGDTVAVAMAYAETMAAANNASAVQDGDRYTAADASYGIGSVVIRHADHVRSGGFKFGDSAVVTVNLKAGRPEPSVLVFSIYNYLGLIVCSGQYDLPCLDGGRSPVNVKIQFPFLRLAPGSYRMNFAVRKGLEIVSWARNAVTFTMAGDNTDTYIYREDAVVSFDSLE